MDRFYGRPAEMGERVTRMGPALLAWFVGGAQIETSLPLPDRPWLVWLSGACVMAATGRLVLLAGPRAGAWRGRSVIHQLRVQIERAPFAWYSGRWSGGGRDVHGGKPVRAGYSPMPPWAFDSRRLVPRSSLSSHASRPGGNDSRSRLGALAVVDHVVC